MFSLVETPSALPGACYLCGSGEKSPYIDWGVSIEFYGALYTCHECTASVASLLGMVSGEKYTLTVSKLDQLAAQNLDLINQVGDLAKSIELLTRAGFNEPVSGAHDSAGYPVNSPDLDLLAVLEDPSKSARKTGKRVDDGTGTPDESGNDKRVDKLRSNEPKSGPRI